VAVAVNGTVQAVGRSFYLRGIPTEGFDVIVPDAALHAGRNEVRVFEVKARKRSVSLIPLGRN
jgi:hypothetical protein